MKLKYLNLLIVGILNVPKKYHGQYDLKSLTALCSTQDENQKMI
jgi:hypothetical protein